jgi:hypothetical protein
MTTSTVDRAGTDEPVRIAVLVVEDDQAEAINVAGPVRSAVRAAFAHPRLASALQALQMDSERLTGRIVARWQNPKHEHETRQLWEKSDGSTTVRWWVDRDRIRPPRVTSA